MAKMQVVVLIGEELKRWRMRRALTQIQLAERCGLSPATIVRIERDQREPQPSTIRKLADALDIDPSELTG
jgi:transcriptional regulator with XRE-family HTH domain